MDLGEPREPILILNHGLTAGEAAAAAAAGISFSLAKTFDGAETDENVWIYRMTRKTSPR